MSYSSSSSAGPSYSVQRTTVGTTTRAMWHSFCAAQLSRPPIPVSSISEGTLCRLPRPHSSARRGRLRFHGSSGLPSAITQASMPMPWGHTRFPIWSRGISRIFPTPELPTASCAVPRSRRALSELHTRLLTDHPCVEPPNNSPEDVPSAARLHALPTAAAPTAAARVSESSLELTRCLKDRQSRRRVWAAAGN